MWFSIVTAQIQRQKNCEMLFDWSALFCKLFNFIGYKGLLEIAHQISVKTYASVDYAVEGFGKNLLISEITS